MIKKETMMSEVVPTRLRITVNDKHTITYRRLEDCFGYEFEVSPKEGADKAVEEVVRMMEDQSYDHGACWRRTSIEEVEKDIGIENHWYRWFVVKFRIRDSW